MGRWRLQRQREATQQPLRASSSQWLCRVCACSTRDEQRGSTECKYMRVDQCAPTAKTGFTECGRRHTHGPPKKHSLRHGRNALAPACLLTYMRSQYFTWFTTNTTKKKQHDNRNVFHISFVKLFILVCDGDSGSGDVRRLYDL